MVVTLIPGHSSKRGASAWLRKRRAGGIEGKTNRPSAAPRGEKRRSNAKTSVGLRLLGVQQ
jgi:hypothetical protein